MKTKDKDLREGDYMKEYEYDEINNDLDIPGVWALWGKDKKTSKKTCLEVAQTENILSEIKSALYILSHEDDEECKKCCEIRTLSWKRNPRYIDKYRDISLEYKDMEIVVLNDSLNIRDRNLRCKMEKAYAEINKAKYWYS